MCIHTTRHVYTHDLCVYTPLRMCIHTTPSHVYTHRSDVYMLRPIEGMTIPGNCSSIPGNTGSVQSWEYSRYYSQDWQISFCLRCFAAASRDFVKIMVIKYVGTGTLQDSLDSRNSRKFGARWQMRAKRRCGLHSLRRLPRGYPTRRAITLVLLGMRGQSTSPHTYLTHSTV